MRRFRRVPPLVAVLLLAPLLALPGPAQAQDPEPAPDLVVTGPGLQPPAPEVGDSVTFNATLRNVGTAPATATVAFLLDGETLYTSPPVVLAANASINVTTPEGWTATGGDHAFLARADPEEEVEEADEGNNDAFLAFSVGARPDLRIAALAFSPPQPLPGEPVVVVATVENAGEGIAGPFQVWLRIDGTPVGTTSVPGLAAGATANATGSWNATSGGHVASAVADPTEEVAETNETNNARTLAFTVPEPPPEPNLVVAQLRWTPEAPRHGDRVRPEALVRNEGNASAAASTTRFHLDGVLLGTVATPALAGNAEAWVVAPEWTAVAGAHVLRAEADANGQVPEADEEDNARAASLGVLPAGPKPDLILESLTADPAAPEEGRPVHLVARVRNGGGDLAGPFRVSFHAGGTDLGSVQAPGLAPGAYADLAAPPWVATPGAVAITARADAGGQVAEADEANNNRTLQLQVAAARPDLVLEDLRTVPPEPRAGDDVAFEAVVGNAGTAPSPATDVLFRVDGRVVGTAPLPALPPGANVTVRSPTWDAITGARLARAIADAQAAVAERDESNNDRTLPLPSLAPLPNLVLEALRLETNGTAEEGEEAPVRLVAVVANRGRVPSGATDLRFEVDNRSLGAVALPALPAGANATVRSRDLLPPAGVHLARALADATGRVTEVSEEDNVRTLRFATGERIGAAGAITLRNLRLSPAEPAPGDTVMVSGEVRNNGTAAARDLVLRLRVDGVEVARELLPTIAAGGRATAALRWVATPGSHTLEVDVLQGPQVVAAAPLRTLSVGEASEGVPWPMVFLAFAVIAVAAAGLSLRKRAT